jgi:hypothetical protein
MAHLWGWQQISIARMEGGVLDREPEFPKWVMDLQGIWEESADQTNAKIYQNWKNGFLRFLDLREHLEKLNDWLRRPRN